MLTNKKVNDFPLPSEIINLMVVMLGCDFHLLMALNKSVRGQISNDEISKKYIFFIPRLLAHYHYSKIGLDHFLRDQHEDPKEKLQKEKKPQPMKNSEHKEVIFPPLKKRHLDPEEAFDFHSTYQISDKLRIALYSSDQEYPSAALRLGLDERYFYGRDYIGTSKQLRAIFRLIASGLPTARAIERIRGFSSLQAQGISWGLSDHAVRTLTVVQLKFLINVVDLNHIEDITQLLLKHKELDDELNLQTIYAIMILDRLSAENALLLLTGMVEQQKNQKIYEFGQHNRAIVRQRNRERYAQMFPEVHIRGIDDEDELQLSAESQQGAFYLSIRIDNQPNPIQAQASQANEVKDESKQIRENKAAPTADVKQEQPLIQQSSVTDLSLTTYSVLPQQQITANRHIFWQIAEQAAESQVSLFDNDYEPDSDSCVFHLF